jgi:protocatechuate 3,4-dioxygenase beta subunit
MGETSRARPLRTLAILAGFLAAGIGATLYAALGGDADVGTSAVAATTTSLDPAATNPATTSAPAKTPAPSPDAARLHGVVRLYRTKAPVEGLVVSLKRTQGETRAATTAADGSFRFDDLPAGPGWELSAAREPFAPISLPLDLAAGQDRDVETLWLEVPVGLATIVHDLGGGPLAGAQVDVFATSRAGEASNENMWWDQRTWESRIFALTSSPKATRTATTDKDGRARIEGLTPGTYRVRASAAGHAASTKGNVLLAPDAAPAPVRLVLGPGHRLEGAVTDEKGRPVAGAVVIAAFGNSWEVGFDRAATTTTEKGAYSFDGLSTGRVTLYLDRKGKPLLQVGGVGVPDAARFDIRLRPGATVRGTATDEEGKPVAGADVRMAMQQSWSPMGAVTDKEGKFELTDVPAGAISYFRIDAKGFMPYPDPSAPASGQGESLREDSTMVRDVVLRRGLAAELRVVAADTNAPIEGCEATLHVARQWGGMSQPWKATTDKEGVAKLGGLVPGNYIVVLRAPGYVQEGMPPWIHNLTQSPDAMPAAWRLNVVGDGAVAKGEYSLTKGATVSGRVWDQNKQPVAGARVTVSGARNEFPVFSDVEGRFKVDAVAPSSRCTASAVGVDETRGASDPFVVLAGRPVENIDVKLAASGRVTGTVRTPDGKPLVGAMVRFVGGRLDENNAWNFQQQFQSVDRWPVGPDGRFEISAAPEGNVTVRADSEGFLPAWKNDVIVRANQETSGLELILKNSVEISGRVEAQVGGVVPGATIVAQYNGTGAETGRRRQQGFVSGLSGDPTAQSDAEGKFTLKGLQEGLYSIYAQAPGFAAGTRVTTKTGAGDVILRLATGKKISGSVKDEGGSPLPGVPVRAQKIENTPNNDWYWWGGSQVYTAPDGTFELQDLADGAYDLICSAAWTWGREVNVEDTKLQGVNAGRDDAFITVKTGSVIEGRLVDRDDQPVRVAWITAQFETGDQRNQDWSSQRWAQAKPDGTFRVAGLKPGSYTIYAYGDFKMNTQKGVGSGARDVKIQVEPGFAIGGRIRDVEGLSLAGQANFQVRKSGDANWGWMNVVQPGDGSFIVLGLDQGRYDLQITVQDYAPTVLSGVAAGERDLTVVVQKGLEVTGVVLDGGGAGVPNANVQAIQRATTPGAQPAQQMAQTDAQGAFKIVGLAAGEYRLIVRAANFAPALVPSVPAGATAVKSVLEVGVSVTGAVADEAGAAIVANGSQLQLANEQGDALCYTQLKPDGTFEFKNVPSNAKWRVNGWAWGSSGQYRFEHEGLIESGATDVKVVAKPNR